MVLERLAEVASSDAPGAISIMDSAGFVDVTALRRHEGVVAFLVPPIVPDGIRRRRGAAT